jgi:hypothetical protein
MTALRRLVVEFRRLFLIYQPRSVLVRVLVVLMIAGLLEAGRHATSRYGGEFCRAKASYRKAIRQGLAVSLNELERHPAGNALPGMSIEGVVWDRAENDWVIFGQAAPDRPGLPLDAVALALRAIHQELEAPGVDIRPASPHGEESLQTVRYFGGVDRTIVGLWFFQFDFWMKRKSLDCPDAGFPEISSYGREAVLQLEAETAGCTSRDGRKQQRHNRYWLCTDNFQAIEDTDLLAFLTTPLRVRTESVPGTETSPASGRGTDALAVRFADQLTAHLKQLSPALPLSLIEDFAQLVAGFSWLATRDPYRDLQPWLDFNVAVVEAPTSVSSLLMKAARSHEIRRWDFVGEHIHEIHLSGGVVIKPRLMLFRSSDASLKRLHKTILENRPQSGVAVWSFTYDMEIA